jgi:hypothetical protein
VASIGSNVAMNPNTQNPSTANRITIVPMRIE